MWQSSATPTCAQSCSCTNSGKGSSRHQVVCFFVCLFCPRALWGEATRCPAGTPICCFLTSCVARGLAFHRQPNVETAEFARVYPELPLTGFFSGGEISNVHSGRRIQTMFHGYTAIYAVLARLPT
eukprot:TRINITY_DN112_c0_g1_i11.p5 TRINITY_DN112_c0_g1~~TRINITY_DN112_c0_g1_i11.p5  ORF type:complete len:126 (+),score=20.57 TRINITY_DN112_c0_g1_i11:842-1219(+)